MYKKVLIFGMIAALSALTFFNSRAVQAEEQVLTVSYADVVDRALNQNRDLGLLDKRISNAWDAYKDEGADSGTYEKDSKKFAYNDLMFQSRQEQANIRTNAAKLYYGILIGQKRIDLKKDEIKDISNQYQMKKDDVERGKDTEDALSALEISLSQAEAALTNLQNTYDSLLMDLNDLMGDSLDQQLVLKNEDIPNDEVDIPDMDDMISNLVSSSYQVTSILNDIHLDKEQMEDASSDLKDRLEDDITSRQYDLENAKAAVEKQARTDYNNILNLKDTVTIKKLEYDRSNDQFQEARLKNSLGLSPQSSVDSASRQALGAEYDYMQAELDLYIAIENYKNFISNYSAS